jgi:hypothetical protein
MQGSKPVSYANEQIPNISITESDANLTDAQSLSTISESLNDTQAL